MAKCLECGSHWSLYIVLLIFLTSVYAGAGPLVLDDASTCSFTSGTENFFFPNKLQRTNQKNNVEVHFNLCDKLPLDICGDDVVACVKHTDGTVPLKGSGWVFSSQNNVRIFNLTTEHQIGKVATSIQTLDIQITNRCFLEGDSQVEIEKTSVGTNYHVYINDPVCPCTIKIKEKLLDLRPIAGTYSVQSALKNFSISLCGPNKFCNDSSVASCVIEKDKIIPLSDMSEEKLQYEEGEKYENGNNQAVLKGRHKRNHFELRLQCNWNLITPKVSYITPTPQGSKYHFLMESLQACVIKKPKCVFRSSNMPFYYYNLSRLDNVYGYKVRNMPVGSQMSINPCGRLKFRGNKNFCTNTYSQICEVRGNEYLNNGSMLYNYEARTSDLSVTYISGITCKDDDTKQYLTHILFRCSKINDGPKVVNRTKCDVRIEWNTREACLKVSKESCDRIPPLPPHKCTTEYNGGIYSLSNLAKENSSYVVKDTDHPSIEYLLNVCKYVVDDEAVCIRGASVILKNYTELDIKKRVKLLGTMSSLSMVDEQLVIEATNGHQCNSKVYSSRMIFVCSHKEEPPFLRNKTNCSFEFVFKTKYACVNQNVSVKGAKCIFQDPSTTYPVELEKSERNMLELVQKDNDNTYYLDICKTGSLRKCSSDKCIYAQPKNVLFIHEGKKYIDIQLNRTCQSADGFNRTLIELQCETDIENNEHFVNRKEWRIKNCILYVPFVTSKACRNDDQSGVHKIEQPQYSIGDVDIVHDPPKEQAKERDVTVSHTDILYDEQNCTKFIKNNYTGYTFNISTLNFQVKVIGCPSIAFNYSNNSVSIVYPAHSPCINVGSPDSKYNVVLKCIPKDDYKILQNDCDKMIVNQPEACKLLEKAPVSAAYSAAAVAGISVSVLVSLATIVAASALVYFKYFQKKPAYDTISYDKEL